MTQALPASAHTRPEASPTLAEQFLALMPRLKRRFQAALPEDLRDELTSVTPHQLEALCHLRSAGGATMHDLARSLGCGMSSVTALADRLLRQGLVERASDPADRRVVRLVATRHALTLIDRFTAARREGALRALCVLDQGELAELVRLLSLVAGEDSP